MCARRKRIPCSILPLIEIAVDLHAAIVTAMTWIPLFPKPSFPFGENKQKPLLIWFQKAYLWELSRSFATLLSLPSDWRGDGSLFCDREWKWKGYLNALSEHSWLEVEMTKQIKIHPRPSPVWLDWRSFRLAAKKEEQGNELVYMNWFSVCFGVGVVRMKEQGKFWFIELWWVTTKNEWIDNIREIWISRGRTKWLLRIFESFEKANWPYNILSYLFIYKSGNAATVIWYCLSTV